MVAIYSLIILIGSYHPWCVLVCLRLVGVLDLHTPRQIGDGVGQLEDAVVGARGLPQMDLNVTHIAFIWEEQ